MLFELRWRYTKKSWISSFLDNKSVQSKYCRDDRSRTRKSSPLDLRFAQSKGPNPGARATFSRFVADKVGGFTVLGGSINVFPVERGIGNEKPGDLTASLASGCGTVISLAFRAMLGGTMAGIALGAVIGASAVVDDRWALFKAGKEGGWSSLSSRSVSSPSLTSSTVVSAVRANCGRMESGGLAKILVAP
jgi:hypothetical protein